MRKVKSLMLGVGVLLLGSTVFKAQTTDTAKAAVTQDAAVKKKAADEEKARLKKPYDPKADASKDIKALVAVAKKENKNIILQAGGNWCIWCLRFNDFVEKTPELKSIVDDNYLYYHLNYSPDNKNEKVFAEYGNPGDKYGYPVFIVLDKNGKMIHVQDSSVLEADKGYGLEKVKEFFNSWKPKS